MNGDRKVRWMVVFWHPDGRTWSEPDFPDVDFWHPDKQTSRMEAARVLWELRERGDTRDWVAAGFPDPFKTPGIWYNPGLNWTLRLSDIESDGNGGAKIRSVAGAWRGRGDPDEINRAMADARMAGTRDWRGE